MIARVQDRKTFAALRTSGVRAGSGPLMITFVPAGSVPSPGAGPDVVPHVAFAVPRRVGNAVERNLLRRRIRAILIETEPDRIPPGAYLVTVRPGAPQLSFPELREHVHRALHDTVRRASTRSGATPAARPRSEGT